MPSDVELLDAWKSGDQQAGRALVERYFDSVCWFFRNKLEANVDDLVQTTFLACVKARERFRPGSSFRAFVFAVARKELCEHYRQRRRDGRALDPTVVTVDALCPTPSAILVQHEEQKLLLHALRRIPLDLQIALELRFWEGMTGPELAVALEIPEGTVRSRLRRAQDLLGERLAELADSPERLESTLGDLEGWARSVREKVEAEG